MNRSLLFVLLAALAAGDLLGQSVAWRRLANPGPPIATAWDAARQRTVLIGYDGIARLWEWNGTSVDERLSALGGVASPSWLGYDPLRHLLVGFTSQGQVGSFDGARWSWQTPPSPPSLTATVRATFDEHRGRIVVYQGGAGASDVHEWDGSQWWSSIGSGPPSRTDAAFAFDPIGQRCVLYGGTTAGGALDDCWSWDGSTWTLLVANAPPGPRAGAAMAFTPTLGALLLYGGTTATTTWFLSGSVWTAVPTAHNPGPIAFAQLVQEPFGMLLAGGSGDPLGTAWRFTGADWVAVATFAAPPSRFSPAVAYDHARSQVVFTGGMDAAPLPTHVFDTRWHGTTPTVSPSPRNGAQMCWSSIEQMVLLFGGIDGANTPLGDTWSWTGTDWLQRSPATSPPPRYGAMLAEDPNGGVLLFGGMAGTNVLGDHWHWNGGQWLQLTPTPLPGPSAFGRAALDPLQNRVVAVGVPPLIAPETWEWDGTAWTRVPTSAFYGAPLLAFDPRRAKVVTQGNPSYEWTGSTWVSFAANTNNISGTVGLVTDHARQRLLAVGTSVAVITPTPALAEPFGYGCALGPSPALHTINDATPGNASFALELGTLAPAAPTFLVLGLGSQNQPLGSGCTLLVAQPLATLFAIAPPSAQVRFPLAIPNDPGLRGVQFVAQGAVWDPQRSLLGSATLTAGLRITIGD